MKVIKYIIGVMLTLTLCCTLFGLWLLSVYSGWWLLEPITFWQRGFCVCAIQIPMGIIFGVINILILAFFLEPICKRYMPHLYETIDNFMK